MTYVHAHFRHESGRKAFIAAAAGQGGQMVLRPDGQWVIVDGLDAYQAGALINGTPVRPCKVAEYRAASADTWSAGDELFWDGTAGELTTSGDGNSYLGTAFDDKLAGQTTAYVTSAHPNDFNSPVNLRVRVTAEQINAGHVLVPTVDGVAPRMIDCAMIAIGGTPRCHHRGHHQYPGDQHCQIGGRRRGWTAAACPAARRCDQRRDPECRCLRRTTLRRY